MYFHQTPTTLCLKETNALLLRARIPLVLVALPVVVSLNIAWAESYVGRVVGVADGDTITVLDALQTQHKVRLAGIDAPEKSQPFGNASRQALAGVVFQREVTVETYKRDRYQREIGKVWLGTTDVALELVNSGLAWHYKQYAHEQPVEDRLDYTNAEVRARGSHLGLWADAHPIPPWVFRRRK